MIDHPSISTLTLGTVQLGIPYGVANATGQPTVTESHRLLQYALDQGIRSLDTARAYGKAEEVIGSFENSHQFTCISKFKLSDAALDNPDMALQEARESVQASCNLLRIPRLPILLFHKDIKQPITKVVQVLPPLFKVLQQEGLIGEGGISVYTPDELSFIQDWTFIRSVQVPMNVFDTRLLQNGRLRTLAANNVNVFIRSIYLQGLLLMPESSLPAHLSFAQQYLNRLNAIADGAGRTVKELAFSFVRDMPGVSSIVVGAETVAQLEENVQLLNTPPLQEAVAASIQEQFQALPEELITPALWAK